jgi:hypothetical protein
MESKGIKRGETMSERISQGVEVHSLEELQRLIEEKEEDEILVITAEVILDEP